MADETKVNTHFFETLSLMLISSEMDENLATQHYLVLNTMGDWLDHEWPASLTE